MVSVLIFPPSIQYLISVQVLFGLTFSGLIFLNFLAGEATAQEVTEVPKVNNTNGSKALLCHQSIEDWEENWLFRKRQRPPGIFNTASSLTMLTDDPVAMLVPLPNDEAGSKAQIGEKDIDEVSELSERAASVTSSIDYSTTSSEENDLEHTKYSVMSLIRSRSTLSGVRPKK